MLRRVLSALVVVALSLVPVVGQAKPTCLAASPCGVERMVDMAASTPPCDRADPAPATKGACETTDLCLSSCAPFVSCTMPSPLTTIVHFNKSRFASVPPTAFATLTVAPDTGPPRA